MVGDAQMQDIEVMLQVPAGAIYWTHYKMIESLTHSNIHPRLKLVNATFWFHTQHQAPSPG